MRVRELGFFADLKLHQPAQFTRGAVRSKKRFVPPSAINITLCKVRDMFGLFRRDRNNAPVERLNDAVMERARQPAFYQECGVPDTLEGRFEMVVLHGFLMVRRLDRGPQPGPDIARDLTDAMFARFEVALRETGVSDIAVPKRMKKLASGYLGRAGAYNEGLEGTGEGSLPLAIGRNILAEEGAVPSAHAEAIAGYVRILDERLAQSSVEDILALQLDWPDMRGPNA